MVRMILPLALAVAAACGAAPPPREQAHLRIIAEPPTASVYVDDRFVATARRIGRRPEAVRTGVHHVTVSAPGHFPHDIELDLPAGLTTVEVRLRPIPP